MHVKRTAAIVLGGAALAAWLSAAIAPAGRTMTIPPVRESAADARSANLADEIARLHDRLRPDAVPRQPGRNLFAFHAPPAAPAPPPVHAALTEIAAPPKPAPVPMKLEGIAEDASAETTVRTAVISTGGVLFLVKEGDAVTPLYRVTRISADVVELADESDGSTRRLALK